jgi:hypothetical protein
MICNPERTTVLSSLGWVDGDAIWAFDVRTGRPRTIPQNTGARYTSLHASGTERFVAVHHFDGSRFLASVSLFSAPEITVSTAAYEQSRTSLSGNAAAWEGLPQLYVAYLAGGWNDHVLVIIDGGHLHIQRLEWYDSTYDKDHQAVVNVLALPDPRYAVISVQRSSVLVVHDLATGKAHQTISLGSQHGNPRLALKGHELWATDYDALVVVDTRSWRVVRRKRLQKASAGTGEFIGDVSFSPDGTCCVARPFQGDVVAFGNRLEIVAAAKLGRQPQEAMALADGEVVARDWKSGDLLRGRMERIGWLQKLLQ